MIYIQIIERKTGRCVKQMTADTQCQAERIQRGVEINMNHDDFKTWISKTPMEVTSGARPLSRVGRNQHP